MMLALGSNGEAVHVTEQSPYDLSRVDRKVEAASYESVDVGFNEASTLKNHNLNESRKLSRLQKEKLLRDKQMFDKIRNLNVMTDYRAKIACEQASQEIKVENTLLEKAILQNTSSPDFNQYEISNLVLREDARYPSRDWEKFVPGDRIGFTGKVPNSWPDKNDVSNTYRGGQMAGADFGMRSVNMNDMMGGWTDYLEDQWAKLTQSAESEVQKAGQHLFQETLCNLTSSCPQPTQPNTTSVVQVPQVPTTQYVQTSIMDTKNLPLILGAVGAFAGLLILISVMRR